MAIWDGLPDAPPWIEHDGSEACPVPAGHLVEKRWPGATAFDGTWATVSRYRDWTAFEEQKAMNKDKVPEWAMREFCKRANLMFDQVLVAGPDAGSPEDWGVSLRLAVREGGRLIAASEKPPIDRITELADDIRNEFWGTTRSRTELADYLRARGVTLKEGDA